jgi:cytidine deaminase
MSRILTFAELNESDQVLVEAALDASAHAYAPYSGFAVGAAVRTKGGQIFSGANFENASYGLSMCAEVSALAVANGADDFDIATLAVVGHKFTSPADSSQVVTPCGRCRQLIFEAAQVSGVDIRVLSCSADLDQIIETPISELLPSAFGPKNLGLDRVWPGMRRNLIAAVHRLKNSLRSTSKP